VRVYKKLGVGDPVPWFKQKSTSGDNYHFDTVGGRYILMCFFLTAGDAHGKDMLRILELQRMLFNDDDISFFGVSIDPLDMLENRVIESMPGIRYFWDFDGLISRLYGAIPQDTVISEGVTGKRFWILLDPALRVMANIERKQDGQDLHEICTLINKLSPINSYLGFPQQAPVLFIPDVFEHDFCQKLIHLYENDGGEDSGFMRDINGKTTGMIDYSHKRRSDYSIENELIKHEIQRKFIRRVVPEIMKVHHFNACRMERYLVGCYNSATNDHFRPHRDNTSKGTAYRKFAVSINLNNDFEGGELSFPEYGRTSYKMKSGMAVVFSCSLLHTVSPMISGKRYAFLPFLYDDAAATLREQSNEYLVDVEKHYTQTNNQSF
jgi:predicted 2-oxoglutarate/Fe(II)-dependent dioxygenase YbiX/peroxiredoxin